MIGTDGNHLSVSKRSIKGLASAAKMVIPQKIKINEIEIKDIKIKNQIEEQIKNIEENNNIKNAIIKEEMYKQGLKDGINLIILCQNQ